MEQTEEKKESKISAEEVFYQVQKSFYNTGLASLLGRGAGFTYLAIASYMDEEGFAYPSQERLADDVGATVATVNNDIKKILKVEVDGKPIMKVFKYRNEAGHSANLYQILPISQVKKFKGKIETIKNPPRKTKKKKTELEKVMELARIEG